MGIDITINAKGLAEFYVDLRDGSYALSMVGTGIILQDPADILNQFFDQGVLRNPQGWSDPRVDRLILEQDAALDPAKRALLFRQIVDVLREGESHVVPVDYYSSGGAMDYRLKNYHFPPTIQLVHKWDHIYWDEDAVKPPTGLGYVE